MKRHMLYLFAVMIAIQIKACTCTPKGLFYVLPDDSANASCLSYPCATLSQYMLNISGMSNVKFLFLSGKHSLTSNITMQHVSNVTLTGVSHDNLVPATIFCHSAKAVIFFSEAFNITFANLIFKNCGGDKQVADDYDDDDDDEPFKAAVYFSTCYHCNIMNITLIGYGISIANLLGESHLDNITLHLLPTNFSLSNWCDQGIKIINNDDDVSINALIFISKITIFANSINRKCDPFYDVIGMSILLSTRYYSITLL